LRILIWLEENLGFRRDYLFQATEQDGGTGFCQAGDKVIQGAYSKKY
jgi:hypothetical protein